MMVKSYIPLEQNFPCSLLNGLQFGEKCQVELFGNFLCELKDKSSLNLRAASFLQILGNFILLIDLFIKLEKKRGKIVF